MIDKMDYIAALHLTDGTGIPFEGGDYVLLSMSIDDFLDEYFRRISIGQAAELRDQLNSLLVGTPYEQ